MKYQDKSFSLGYGSKKYSENWEKAFGKDKEEEVSDSEEEEDKEESEE